MHYKIAKHKVPKEVKQLQAKIVESAINTPIYDLVEQTPLQRAALASSALGVDLWHKREDVHEVFSFKLRGAYHKMKLMPKHKLANGVIAASAGNHAQGVACAAARLGVRASIVVPKFTQQIKIDAIIRRGAKVIQYGENFDQCLQHTKQLAKERKLQMVLPFDDLDIICGNATIASEIIRQAPRDLAEIYCAIGGGGLIAGIATFIKFFRPKIKIIGVEADESASMLAAMQAGKLVSLPRVGSFAESIAVAKVGKLPFTLCRYFVDELVSVSNDEICSAIHSVYDDTRTLVEPAAAAGLAAMYKLRRGKQSSKNTPVVVNICCGANTNFERLQYVVERSQIGRQAEAILAVTIDERAGAFREFCSIIGGKNITEFNYRMSESKQAHIFVGVSVQNYQQKDELIAKLNKHKLPTIDLSDDELAKLHIRHTVGGRYFANNERLYRFIFPERPGALLKFLNGISQSGFNWNISLFHYRNHGADVGRCLVGTQVPDKELKKFIAFIDELGYHYVCEDDNPAYQLFLRTKA